MRDIVVLIFLICCIVAALKKPWWGVLSLAIFSYLNPHAYAWGAVRSLPVYYVLFLVVVVSTFNTKDKQPIPKDWRISVFITLWFYFIFTTTQSPLQDIAWEKFLFVSKVFVPFYFTWVLINTREKLYYLISTIGASIGLVAVKGGIFAILTGFGHRVYGPPNTQFEDNNLFAVAMLIAVPLLLVWEKEVRKSWLKKGILLSIPIIYAASLSSWSRGALLTMIALTFTLISNSKRKYLMIPLVIGGTFFVIPYLPEEWFGRMHTLETYEEDASAMSRIEAWTDGWNHALSHPFTGAGFDGWIHVTMRDWHSSYVEMLAEHGFIAFGLWISLILGSVLGLTRLSSQAKRVEGMEWVRHYSLMVRTSIICYMVGTAFLGLSYWDLIYHLVFISMLIKKFALQEFSEKARTNEQQYKKNRNIII
ncbi:putative O-glycosylation ligase, exosortase A system-associated [Methylomonas sp. LW13]|uniref:O-glycosylation ligase, exosortase A system-associated n=1 Tax=Methylomonas defluvii TaxID=3045149 RepID=A0ABU4UA99_9GAMM|nr:MULTISPECIES: putative O-glycosylation ligase, exosortase A system-associated [unclassified Methylomonas]MDX8126336.1 putative O-glycosylation ligase, exosortase A system-associated [Methylomonas sp. OY6]PKD42122.1 putative O-glycosylation ligase, exosortase A system-associated [Methylomonas sp. Kb3]QBC26900.1 putative O-glycosylation ligase, exosortase A system-associated [Methylomonas sp. LW13]